MTSKQFYIMLFITTISLKVQKLPSILYDSLGKDGYLLLLAYFIVDLVGIALAFFVLKTLKNRPIMPQNKNIFVMLLSKILVLAIVLYFLIQGLLLYESIQNLFEHILFDNLSWVVFSFLLLFTIYFLASSGITNIARNFELYFIVIVVSYIMISIFGASKADFSAVLPFQTINVDDILSKFVDFNLWFGDFFLILFMGRHAKDIKFKWTILIYSLTIAFILLLFVELNGIYGVYTAMKPSLVTTITEQSMLGVGIGRVDWFLILLTEVGTILSCGTCIFFSKQCLNYVFPKIKENYLLIVIAVALYFVDVFYLIDTHLRESVFTGYMSVVSASTKWVSFILIVLVCLVMKVKSQKNAKLNQNTTEKKCKNYSKTPSKFRKNTTNKEFSLQTSNNNANPVTQKQNNFKSKIKIKSLQEIATKTTKKESSSQQKAETQNEQVAYEE